jgi:hypothetical protein
MFYERCFYERTVGMASSWGYDRDGRSQRHNKDKWLQTHKDAVGRRVAHVSYDRYVLVAAYGRYININQVEDVNRRTGNKFGRRAAEVRGDELSATR